MCGTGAHWRVACMSLPLSDLQLLPPARLEAATSDSTTMLSCRRCSIRHVAGGRRTRAPPARARRRCPHLHLSCCCCRTARPVGAARPRQQRHDGRDQLHNLQLCTSKCPSCTVLVVVVVIPLSFIRTLSERWKAARGPGISGRVPLAVSRRTSRCCAHTLQR